LIRPAVLLHERFESTPILGKIKWPLLREHGISRVAGFLENNIFLENLIVIFVNNSPKGLTWPNVKKFNIYSQSLLRLPVPDLPLGHFPQDPCHEAVTDADSFRDSFGTDTMSHKNCDPQRHGLQPLWMTSGLPLFCVSTYPKHFTR